MYTLSIIIPVYNVEKYLPACLESVYRDLPDGCQVILVDDGTPDSSGVLCDKAKEQYPHVTTVIHQENMGLGGARNTGIDAASGEYLFFPDSDDTVTEDSVDTILEYIDRYEPDIIRFCLRCTDENGKLIYETGADFPKGTVFDPSFDRFILTQSPSACDKVMRASLFKESGIKFPPRVWYEDIRTTPKLMSLCCSAVYLEEPLYNYLQRSGSIMNSAKTDRNIEIVEALEDLTDWFAQNGRDGEYRDELEYLVILHVYLTATVRVIRQAGTSHPLLAKFREFTKNRCRNVFKNPYVKALPARRRLALRLVDMKLYLAVKLLFSMKNQ